MSNFNFDLCELHLKKRVRELPYIWGGKQTNEKDKITQNIYNIRSYRELINSYSTYPKHIKNYAYNRWFNFWSAFATESFFVNNPYINVKSEKNKFHKTIDFYINGIPFDHKSSKLPDKFNNRLDEINNIDFKKELIEWLYANQSKQQRFHQDNRLFVILIDSNNIKNNWKVKSELSLIKGNIHEYLYNISKNKTKYISIVINGKSILSDIIYVIK